MAEIWKPIPDWVEIYEVYENIYKCARKKGLNISEYITVIFKDYKNV